jgi:hypothetical protein
MTQEATEQNNQTIHEYGAHAVDHQQVAPRTLTELLDKLTAQGASNLPALRSKAAVLADFLQKPADQITIDEVEDAKPGLRSYLKSRRLAENSIQAYVYEVRTLLNHAERLGWKPNAEIPVAWHAVLERCVAARCDDLCRYVLRKRKAPKQVVSADVDSWIEGYVKQGKALSTARMRASAFWKVLVASGALQELPVILKGGFGVSLDEFPEPLKSEVEKLLQWKQANYSAGRSKRGKIRAESAGNLRRSFSELFGFTVRVMDMTGIDSICTLVTPDIIGKYIEWAINDRKVRGQSLCSRLVVIKAALSQHPQYRETDVTWLKDFVESIPTETEAELKEKQMAKQVPYASVEAIPSQIHAERKAAARRGEKDLALVVRNELLMLWLTVLPWRQRNLRECRVGGSRPNLFKAKISSVAAVAKSDWVEEALKADPEAEFWQVKFSSEETKVGNSVHLLVPRPLIPLLEEYLQHHRPHLVQGTDSEDLFPSEAGTRISRARMTIIVSELTLRHIGKRVTPHTFRHIVAYAWLDDHPEDYLTLSKILFHMNINTTLKCYGARCNESNGARGMEKWVESRKKKVA